MKRYRFRFNKDTDDCEAYEHPDGDYVLQSDAAEMRKTIDSQTEVVCNLKAENDELHKLIARLAELLTGVANAIKGEPPPLVLHDWSDLPKLAGRLRKACAAALEVCDSPCRLDHHGLCQEHNLRRNEAGEPECQVTMLRAALDAGKEGGQ